MLPARAGGMSSRAWDLSGYTRETPQCWGAARRERGARPEQTHTEEDVFAALCRLLGSQAALLLFPLNLELAVPESELRI